MMEKREILRIAKIAIYKRWSFEQLKYSDELYQDDESIDDIWDLICECDAIGQVAFNRKYSEAPPPDDEVNHGA